MSHDSNRKSFYNRERENDRDRGHTRPSWSRPERIDYRDPRDPRISRKRSRSISRSDIEKRRHSPRKNDKDMIDENILSEISKLPEPSELWEPNTQFQESGFSGQPPPPSLSGFQPEPSNPSYAGNYQPSYSGIYDDFPSTTSAPPDIASWNQMSLPPPPGPHTTYQNAEDQLKKEAAIETEMRHQKAALSKQREDYIKKAGILKKELDTLKDQRNELRGDAKRSPSPDTKRFLKENTKLQLEIQNKLKTITNVVDMLNGIIGEEAQEVHDIDDSPDHKRKSRSPSNKKFNYVYYDPEMHWCRVCNEFPPTAKDYLNHLHSAAHHKMAAAHMEAPWHTVSGMNEGYPSFPSAPTKRTPIRGLQFFVPSTAWYCKLCDQFIGDLHCASAHLKSITHSKNYINFVEQNPHWETDWMSDRQKAFEKARANLKNKPPEEKPQYTPHTISFSKDGFHTKRKKSPTPPAEEKKRKKEKKKNKKRKRDSSSSESSESSSSASDNVKRKLKKSKKLKNIDVTDGKALEEWMSTIKTDRLSDNDKKLLDNLKTRIKKERDDKRRSTSRDRQRITEMQRKIRESEARASKRAEGRARDERRGERGERGERAPERRAEAERGASPDKQEKKPEIRKMPFIGKMPVYKHLGKNIKTEPDAKKEEDKNKEDVADSEKQKEEIQAEVLKKKQEIDAEIQKKVAQFKQKIAKAQHERSSSAHLNVVMPPLPPLMHAPVPLSAPAPPPMPPGAPALPKDFQEALDIIFPTDPAKNAEKLHQDLMTAMQPGILGVAPLMPPFNQQLLMPNMFPFDLNNMPNMSNMSNMSLFPQPQLYDQHVPLVANKQNNYKHKPSPRPKHELKPYNKMRNNGNTTSRSVGSKANGEDAKKKEELDDLAMLGIDASDVGAGI